MRSLLTTFLAAVVVLAATFPARAEWVTKKNATVNFIEDARVPAQEEGLLTRVFAQNGQYVAAGEVLAQVDDTLVQLQLNVAAAELEVAQRRSQDTVSIEFANAAAAVYKAEHERLLRANEKFRGAVTQADIDLARLQHEQYVLQAKKSEFELGIAKLEVKVSKAKMDAAEEHIERSKIKARWEGVVDRVVRFTGDWVKPGDPILRMIRMDKLRVTCSLDATKFGPQDVKGQPVTVRVQLRRGAVETFKSRITNCSSMIEGNDEFHVWTDLDNPKRNGDYVLRPGMWAEMTIETK